MQWAYDLSVEVFGNAIDFNELQKNETFTSFIKLVVPFFLDMYWVEAINKADDYFDTIFCFKEERKNKLLNWKEKFPEFANNKIITEIIQQELLQYDLENAEDVVESRLKVYQLALSLICPKFRNRTFCPFFRGICLAALIFDDANDIYDDMKTGTKTLFTMFPPDKAIKKAEVYLMEAYTLIHSKNAEEFEQDFFSIDLLSKTLLMERNIEPKGAAEIFWLLAVYRLRNPGSDGTIIPFDLSLFLRSL